MVCSTTSEEVPKIRFSLVQTERIADFLLHTLYVTILRSLDYVTDWSVGMVFRLQREYKKGK